MTLQKELKDFTTAWADRETREKAKAIAATYVAGHEAELEKEFGKFSIEEMVKFIDLARAKGDEASRIKADMWLLARFEPQRIVGNMVPGRGRR